MKLARIAFALIYSVGTILTSQAQTAIKSSVFSNGSVNASSASYKLNGLAGQDITGKASSSSYVVQAGFTLSPAERLPDLNIVAFDVNPTTIGPGGKVAINATIRNSGDLPIAADITIKLFLSDNTTYEPGVDTELSPSFVVGSTLAANTNLVFPAVGQSNEVTIPANTPLKAYQLLLVVDPGNTIVEKNETDNVASKGLTVNTTSGTDNLPPVFGTITKPASVADNAKIIASVTDNLSGVGSVKFFHRIVSSTGTFTEEGTVKDGDNYSVTLTAAWADETGIECYFTAVDLAGNSAQPTAKIYVYAAAPSNQTIPGLLAGGQIEDYSIFSIPYALADNRIDEVFKTLGEYDKTKWRIVRYQGGRNVDKKEGLTKIERGQGFWFNSVTKSDISIGAGTAVKADESPNFSMVLEKGWNQIGDPFTFDLTWASVLAANASSASKLSQQVLVYNPSNVSLDPSNTLKAWSGGFVLADEALTLTIPVSLKGSSGRIPVKVIEQENPDGEQWMLNWSIQQGKVVNTLGGFGMHPDAEVGKDVYDIAAPPSFSAHVSLLTPHREFFVPKFVRDIVPTTDSFNWGFELESNMQGSASLQWNQEFLAETRAALLLYDVDQRVLVDMKSTDRYQFDPNVSRKLRVFFGASPSKLSPDIQEFAVAWPNPATDVVHVPFLVKETSSIRIEVLDMTGRTVAVPVDGVFESGYHVGTWNLIDHPVAPGTYLYRMTGSGKVGRIVIR